MWRTHTQQQQHHAGRAWQEQELCKEVNGFSVGSVLLLLLLLLSPPQGEMSYSLMSPHNKSPDSLRCPDSHKVPSDIECYSGCNKKKGVEI